MTTPADRAAAAHQASWRHLHGLWGRGWLELRPGFMASFCELPAPAFNGATVYGPCAPEELTAAMRKLDRSGYPYSLLARPGVHAECARVARRFGLELRPAVPLMLCEQPPPAPSVSGLRIRTLAPAEHAIHAEILAEAFTAPLQLSVELTPPEMLVPENVWTLVGMLSDGITGGVTGGGRGGGGRRGGGDPAERPVTTAFVDLYDGVGALHNVGTREALRGRGFGTAISAAATRIAFGAGAELVMLLSSPMGVGVYESIGFHTVESWSVWESPDA